MNYKRINIITGWVVCLIACMVYILTREASASFWDCGEFISSAYKLQIPHAPGAPLFLLLGRFFIILFGNPAGTAAALKVNLLSALASGFTILFLFWTITHLAKKLIVKTGEVVTMETTLAIMAAGVVGALAYTFTDSFWFSAVEGEVYAMSSFFTAIVFWAILKWENEADSPYADRWIVFIAYMIGLSIGVHLLCLLVIPAIILVYYFRKYKATLSGTIIALIAGVIILGFVQVFVIKYTVQLAGWFDVKFVNSLGLPFNSGTYFFLALIVALLVFGVIWSKRNGRYLVHLSLLSIAFILIGYSTYFTVVIRANADPSINMQNVDDPATLEAYLDRSQYGDFPILYGQDFTAQPSGTESTGNQYYKNEKTGKYDVVGQSFKYTYAPEDEHFFPRMWDASNEQGHAAFYRSWENLAQGEKPSFFDNLHFFATYQVGWMYMRYFMWNFSGRQNDVQGYGNPRDGNWITGINFIDNMRLGDQSKMPESLKHNKAHNKLYLLPFLLGIIGLIYQLNRDKKNFLVVGLLFFFTGLAIVVYLNQAGNQPRERDYAYVGSFYAYTIWIGIGVLSVYEFFKRKIAGKPAAMAAGLLCLVAVPVLMACQEWDDHDRSQKTLAPASAADYLRSCKPNAILFTVGDNDTYPLWFAQEVQGVRPDIRIINMSLLGVDWYIDELRHKVNKADAVPISWSPDKYRGDNRNYLQVYNQGNKIPEDQYFSLADIMSFVGSDDPQYQLQMNNGQRMNYLPTTHFYLPVNRQQVIQEGVVPPSDTADVPEKVPFTYPNNTIFKGDLMALNIIAADNWKRPIYFTSPVGLGLNDYLETDGLTYRLVPVKAKQDPNDMFGIGNVNTDFMYNNLMTKFEFGGAEKPGTYFDEPNRHLLLNIRSAYGKLGITLATDNKKDSALKVLNYADKNILDQNFPYALTSPGNQHNLTSLQIVYGYYEAGDSTKAEAIASKIDADCEQQLSYYNMLSKENMMSSDLQRDQQAAMFIIQTLQSLKVQFTNAHKKAGDMMGQVDSTGGTIPPDSGQK